MEGGEESFEKFFKEFPQCTNPDSCPRWLFKMVWESRRGERKGLEIFQGGLHRLSTGCPHGFHRVLYTYIERRQYAFSFCVLPFLDYILGGSFSGFALPCCISGLILLLVGSFSGFALPCCVSGLVLPGRLPPACRWRCPRSPARALPLTRQGAHPLHPAPLRG